VVRAKHYKLTILLNFAAFQFTAYGKIGSLTISNFTKYGGAIRPAIISITWIYYGFFAYR
jgi:hypothetical protein